MFRRGVVTDLLNLTVGIEHLPLLPQLIAEES